MLQQYNIKSNKSQREFQGFFQKFLSFFLQGLFPGCDPFDSFQVIWDIFQSGFIDQFGSEFFKLFDLSIDAT